MFSINFLEAAAAGGMSVWIPVIGLGWFLLMTLVGWQVSRHTVSQPPAAAPFGNNPSEFDNQ
jgi:hypothetical protein